MTDLQETAAGEVAQAPVPAIGPSLKQAREARGLSLEDVASHLRLSVRQINALENDEFTALPEATITRGFIRNYTRLLEIPAEPLLDIYRSYSPAGSPKAITIQSANILISGGDRRPWLAYILASVVIAALLGAWLVYFEHPRDLSAEKPAEAAAPVAIEQESQAVAEPLPIAALPAAEREAAAAEEGQLSAIPAQEASAATPAAPAAASPVTAPAASQASAKDLSRISLRFAEQSWVSVVDRDNKEILNKNKPAGSEETIEGLKPFKVVVGNAAGTTLTFNGKTVDLAPHTRLNVARLTLE